MIKSEYPLVPKLFRLNPDRFIGIIRRSSVLFTRREKYGTIPNHYVSFFLNFSALFENYEFIGMYKYSLSVWRFSVLHKQSWNVLCRCNHLSAGFADTAVTLICSKNFGKIFQDVSLWLILYKTVLGYDYLIDILKTIKNQDLTEKLQLSFNAQISIASLTTLLEKNSHFFFFIHHIISEDPSYIKPNAV